MPSPRPVRPLILVPIDPASDQIGGIQSFIRGFVKWAPDDFDPEFVGVSADPERRPLGRWLTVAVGGRPARAPRLAARFDFLPTWVDETIFFSRPEDERSSLRAELAAALGLPAGARI